MKPAKAASRLVNAADLPDAESADGFSLFLDERKIGGAAKVIRSGLIEAPLDPEALKDKNELTLLIRANGGDGFHLYRVRSGPGPALKVVY